MLDDDQEDEETAQLVNELVGDVQGDELLGVELDPCHAPLELEPAGAEVEKPLELETAEDMLLRLDGRTSELELEPEVVDGPRPELECDHGHHHGPEWLLRP